MEKYLYFAFIFRKLLTNAFYVSNFPEPSRSHKKKKSKDKDRDRDKVRFYRTL